jgi:hypothetical protein
VVIGVSHADPIAIMRLGLLSQGFNNRNLHATVYPVRSSITHVMVRPDRDVELMYFNPANAAS